MLLFCLTTKTYLSPQLIVYMPKDLPVHYPTCSLWLFHSDKPFVLTCPLTCCSKYSQIYIFINQPVSIFVCFSPGFTCTLICQIICWSAYRQTHPKMNVPVNFDASGYNHEDLPADSTVLPVQCYASIPIYLRDLPVHPTTALHIYRSTRK